MSSDEEIAWCQNLWNSINHGGTWAIPRSGLMFRKESTRNALVLYDRMPHHPDMEISAKELREIQNLDVEATRERFAHLDISVIDETVTTPAVSKREMDAFLNSVAGRVSDT